MPRVFVMKKPSLILLLLAMPISACTTVGPDYAAP